LRGRQSVLAGAGALVLAVVALGILLGTSGGHDPRPLPRTPELDAYCADAQTLRGLPAALSAGATPEDLSRQLTAVRAAMTDVADKAPRQIKTDLGLFVRTYTRVLDAAVAVDYDMTKVPQATVDALDAPSVRKALQRVAAFDRRNCKIR
jgi:hypothetical protein